jgi:ubiquinone/menaquinone biosynthesis C-methylase UbiE
LKKTILERQKIEELYHDTARKQNIVQRGHLDSGEKTHYHYFYDLIGRVSDLKILEVGCGSGWLSIGLAQDGAKVYGIDISSELIGEAIQEAIKYNCSEKTTFNKMAVEDLTFEDGYFDMVIGSAILHHTDIQLAIKNISRVLGPQGRAIFIEPLNENILLKIWRKVTPWRRSPTERALLKSDLGLISSVFPHSQYYYFGFTSIIGLGLLMFFPDSKILKKVNSYLEKLDTFIAVRFESLGPQYAVVVLELKKAEC